MQICQCSDSSASVIPGQTLGSTALGDRVLLLTVLGFGLQQEDVPSWASCSPVKGQPRGGSSSGQGVQGLAGARRVG